MNISYEELVKKILKFWKAHENQKFTPEILKSTFNKEEIEIICFDEHFYHEYFVIKKFIDLLPDVSTFYNSKESEALFYKYYDTNSEIFDLVKNFDKQQILSLFERESEQARLYYLWYIKDDDILLSLYEKTNNKDIKLEIVTRFNSDELKLKYLKEFTKSGRIEIISSFKDKSLIEDQLSILNPNKGALISALDEEKKSLYFKKYFWYMNKDEHSRIISSIKDEQLVIELLKECSDQTKSYILKNSTLSIETQDAILSMIKNKDIIAYLLHYYVDSSLITKYIHLIKKTEHLVNIINNLDEKERVQFFDKLNKKYQIEMIKDICMPNIKFDLLKKLDDSNAIIDIIEHCEYFPEYNESYQNIVNIYAEKYKLNKEHLMSMVKNNSMILLKYIKNKNIQKIINSNEEDFNNLLSIVSKDKLKLNDSSMNDIINSLLQREFRNNQTDIILVFPIIMQAIDQKNTKLVIEKLNQISASYNYNDYLKNNNWSVEQFVNLLMEKDQKAVDCLHEISAKYIRGERNSYIQQNFNKAKDITCQFKYEKNELLKAMISTYPMNIIMTYFPKNMDNSEGLYTDEEMNLLQNRDVIQTIIEFKQNPSNFSEMPSVVKDNIRAFNSFFEKFVVSKNVSAFKGLTVENKVYKNPDVDYEYMTQILMNLDIDKLNKALFNDEELFNNFMKLWEQYKLGGWGKSFDLLLSSSNMAIDAETVANFIQYFGASYKQLEAKKNSGEISNLSITALLDMAECYSQESQKYSMIFGKDNFKNIASNPGPNSSTMSKEKRIDKATQLLSTIRNRQFVTIPPTDNNYNLSNGKTINIVAGNISNPINLTLGERTGACMRIGGAGDSLFNFCLENENGFHVRFHDPVTGNFISRVSGFRNGNTVFLNQLRESKNSNYSDEDLVEACKLLANEMVEKTKGDSVPIDNVVISPDLAMQASRMVVHDIKARNFREGLPRFFTDVDEMAIVLATSSKEQPFKEFKPGNDKVTRYNVERDKKRVLYNSECIDYINHIHTMDEILSGKKIEDVVGLNNNQMVICMCGEDWYVALDKEGNIVKYVMQNTNNPKLATEEMQNAMLYIEENVTKELAASENLRR